MRGLASLLLLLFILLAQAGAVEPTPEETGIGALTSDATWQGEVTLERDVLVPRGVTLRILPGTTVRVRRSLSTKTDPEYLSSLTEILVRGSLLAEGTPEKPIRFIPVEQTSEKDYWAGIVLDRGEARLAYCLIAHAETGLHVIHASPTIRDSEIRENRNGVAFSGASGGGVAGTRFLKNGNSVLVYGQSNPVLKGNIIEESEDTGIYIGRGAKPVLTDNRYSGQTDGVTRNRLTRASLTVPLPFSASPSGLKAEPVRISSTTLLGDTEWQGQIIVDGVIRVPAGVRLLIHPGTVIRFTRFDSNGDGIGENEIFIQGRLIAKGTPEEPILFTSAEEKPGPGDWGGINMMVSESLPNLIEYCRIEYGYRGLHAHFSLLEAAHSLLRENYRAIQFQESQVSLRDNVLLDNRSGARFRDSRVEMLRNRIHGGYEGLNSFRTELTFKDNTVTGQLIEAGRIRESRLTASGNRVYDNRRGLFVLDSEEGRIEGNLIIGNDESGLMVRGSSIDIRGNILSRNGWNGISLDTFKGSLSGNDLEANGRYALGNRSAGPVRAEDNWWGGLEDPSPVVFDRQDDAKLGEVVTAPVSKNRNRSRLAGGESIRGPVTWSGEVLVYETVSIAGGGVLRIDPGTSVLFAKKDEDGDEAGDIGIKAGEGGRLLAQGTEDRPIRFDSHEQPARVSDWAEVTIEHGGASEFSHVRVAHASWGLHLHYTPARITDSVFENNYGGLRARSGPVSIRSSRITDNVIGIRTYFSSPEIRGNLIGRNRTGIFCREGSDGTVIQGNDFVDNAEYHLKLGDAQSGNITATDNWWGTSDETAIRSKFFDREQETYIGRILFEPFRERPATGFAGATAGGAGSKDR